MPALDVPGSGSGSTLFSIFNEVFPEKCAGDGDDENQDRLDRDSFNKLGYIPVSSLDVKLVCECVRS